MYEKAGGSAEYVVYFGSLSQSNTDLPTYTLANVIIT